MFKKSSKIFFTILLCEIFLAFSLMAISPAVAQDSKAVYTPYYLKGFGGNPAALVVSIYRYALGAVGIVAFGAIVYGAILRITSAGNPSQVQEANAWIIGAVSGVALLFGAYLILQTINPQLVKLGEIESAIESKIRPPQIPKTPVVTPKYSIEDKTTSTKNDIDKDLLLP